MGAQRRLLVAAGLLTVAAMGPARPLPITTCGGAWVGPVAECTFEFAGFPLTVTGYAEADPWAAVTMTLAAEPDGYPIAPPIVLVACAATRQDNVACSETFGPVAGIRGLPVGVRLWCRVAGMNGGTFSCESGILEPPPA